MTSYKNGQKRKKDRLDYVETQILLILLCIETGPKGDVKSEMIARVQEQLLLLTNTYMPTTIWHVAMNYIPQELV